VIVASSNSESVRKALATLPRSATGAAVDHTDSAAVAAFFAGLDPFDHLVFTAAESVRSTAAPVAERGRVASAFRTDSELLEATITVAPWAAASRAVASPIPDVPPRTTTRWSCRVTGLPFVVGISLPRCGRPGTGVQDLFRSL
jgi:hypothetical protein